MNVSQLTEWARTPLYLAGVLAVLAAVLAYSVRRARRSVTVPPAAVVVAAFGALLCTAYSGDTSWRFARDHLGMASVHERAVMFAAAEVALFAMALMARQNLTATGAPGTPGVLVWVVTGVQVIPAYSESGVIAGSVRAFFGPVVAALLWHLAMGIELRHHKPGANSQSLPAVLVRELRERMLSHLGLSVRGRDAAQITRDRWTGIATRRAAHLAVLQAGTSAPAWRTARARRRLAAAVDRSDAGVLPAQRGVLLDRLAAHRGAAELASMTLPSPWATVAQKATVEPAEVEIERVPAPVPEVYPAIERGVPAVPEAVPAGVPGDEPQAPVEQPAEPTRTRTGVHAGYAPQDPLHALRDRIGEQAFADAWPEVQYEPDDDSPPPPGEDTITAQARRDFLADLIEQRVPSIRGLKDRYGIGQARATRIRDELKKGLT